MNERWSWTAGLLFGVIYVVGSVLLVLKWIFEEGAYPFTSSNGVLQIMIPLILFEILIVSFGLLCVSIAGLKGVWYREKIKS